MISPRFPEIEKLRPSLDKLTTHPGSVILISIEHLETQSYPRVAFAWLSAEERGSIKNGLTRVRTKRQKTKDQHDE